MKTFFIATGQSDGVQAYFAGLAEELKARGHRVHLLLYGQHFERASPHSNPAIHYWPSPRPTRLQDARFLHDLTRHHRADCYIANFGTDNVMALVGAWNRVPVRISWYRTMSSQVEMDSHVSAPQRQFMIWRKQQIKRLNTHIIANSQGAQQDAQQILKIPAEKSIVFYNLLADPLMGKPPMPDAERSGVICVSRLFYSKGQDILLDALALLKTELPSFRVTFLGGGPMLDAARQQAEANGIADHCEFLGHVPYHEVLQRISSAQVMVTPSRENAFGWVNIEAMSMGTPVIASNTGGHPEIIRDGVDGFLFPVGDAAVLADRLRRLLIDPALRRQMGQNARERFLQTFELRSGIGQVSDWLETVVPARSS